MVLDQRGRSRGFFFLGLVHSGRCAGCSEAAAVWSGVSFTPAEPNNPRISLSQSDGPYIGNAPPQGALRMHRATPPWVVAAPRAHAPVPRI